MLSDREKQESSDEIIKSEFLLVCPEILFACFIVMVDLEELTLLPLF
jgi:hypothetical protein